MDLLLYGHMGLGTRCDKTGEGYRQRAGEGRGQKGSGLKPPLTQNLSYVPDLVPYSSHSTPLLSALSSQLHQSVTIFMQMIRTDYAALHFLHA